MVSGVVAGGQLPPPLNFGMSENLCSVQKFSSKNAKFGAEKFRFWENLAEKLKV